MQKKETGRANKKTKVRNTAQRVERDAGHTVPTQAYGVADDFQSIFPEEYQLNLSDFALFLSVMKIKEAYEDVLGIILDEPHLKLKEVKVEQVVLNKSGKRAIRLDAWAQDWQDRRYDMEMQNDTDGDNVRKRSRFYQSMLDTPVLKSGKKTRYK